MGRTCLASCRHRTGQAWACCPRWQVPHPGWWPACPPQGHARAPPPPTHFHVRGALDQHDARGAGSLGGRRVRLLLLASCLRLLLILCRPRQGDRGQAVEARDGGGGGAAPCGQVGSGQHGATMGGVPCQLARLTCGQPVPRLRCCPPVGPASALAACTSRRACFARSAASSASTSCLAAAAAGSSTACTSCCCVCRCWATANASARLRFFAGCCCGSPAAALARPACPAATPLAGTGAAAAATARAGGLDDWMRRARGVPSSESEDPDSSELPAESALSAGCWPGSRSCSSSSSAALLRPAGAGTTGRQAHCLGCLAG